MKVITLVDAEAAVEGQAAPLFVAIPDDSTLVTCLSDWDGVWVHIKQQDRMIAFKDDTQVSCIWINTGTPAPFPKGSFAAVSRYGLRKPHRKVRHLHTRSWSETYKTYSYAPSW